MNVSYTAQLIEARQMLEVDGLSPQFVSYVGRGQNCKCHDCLDCACAHVLSEWLRDDSVQRIMRRARDNDQQLNPHTPFTPYTPPRRQA